jgi:hypothetical protein
MQWIKKLFVHHALLKQTSHLTFPWHTKTNSFCVINAGVFHVSDDRWSFAGEVDAYFFKAIFLLRC